MKEIVEKTQTRSWTLSPDESRIISVIAYAYLAIVGGGVLAFIVGIAYLLFGSGVSVEAVALLLLGAAILLVRIRFVVALQHRFWRVMTHNLTLTYGALSLFVGAGMAFYMFSVIGIAVIYVFLLVMSVLLLLLNITGLEREGRFDPDTGQLTVGESNIEIKKIESIRSVRVGDLCVLWLSFEPGRYPVREFVALPPDICCIVKSAIEE